MNILVIENEIYLAQKIVSKLINDGFNCDYRESLNIDNFTKEYDVILLSTSFPFNFCNNITQLSHIKNHKFFIYERLIKPINRHILL